MDGATLAFETNRTRLFAVAYRLLGSRADAEDVLQDVYINWSQCAARDIESITAFLVTITKRLCFDRMRRWKHEREMRVDGWTAAGHEEPESPSPERRLEIAEDASSALLAALERLGHEELAAFLLHDVFDYDYPEVAGTLGKAETACRQILHRARSRVRETRARFAVAQESQQRLLRKFLVATQTGDRRDIMALLAEHVDYVPGVEPTSLPPATARSALARRSGGTTDVPTHHRSRAPVADEASPFATAARTKLRAAKRNRYGAENFACPVSA